MKKVFKYGDVVRVKLPGKKAFTGPVYSEYKQGNRERVICVTTPSGSGIGYLVRYVSHVKKSED